MCAKIWGYRASGSVSSPKSKGSIITFVTEFKRMVSDGQYFILFCFIYLLYFILYFVDQKTEIMLTTDLYLLINPKLLLLKPFRKFLRQPKQISLPEVPGWPTNRHSD